MYILKGPCQCIYTNEYTHIHSDNYTNTFIYTSTMLLVVLKYETRKFILLSFNDFFLLFVLFDGDMSNENK